MIALFLAEHTYRVFINTTGWPQLATAGRKSAGKINSRDSLYVAVLDSFAINSASLHQLHPPFSRLLSLGMREGKTVSWISSAFVPCLTLAGDREINLPQPSPSSWRVLIRGFHCLIKKRKNVDAQKRTLRTVKYSSQLHQQSLQFHLPIIPQPENSNPD